MKAHKELRKVMIEYDIKRDELAEVVGRGLNYTSSRMCGQQPWTIDDIYKICDFFNDLDPENKPMPYEEIPKFFPSGGTNAITSTKRKLERVV